MVENKDLHFRWESSRMDAFSRCAKTLGLNNPRCGHAVELWNQTKDSERPRLDGARART